MHSVAEELKTNTTYNGWSNRETQVVSLWLGSEPYAYDMLQHIIKAFETISEQAEELENCVRNDDNSMTGEASMWRDLLNASLGRVNWYEIAENNQVQPDRPEQDIKRLNEKKLTRIAEILSGTLMTKSRYANISMLWTTPDGVVYLYFTTCTELHFGQTNVLPLSLLFDFPTQPSAGHGR